MTVPRYADVVARFLKGLIPIERKPSPEQRARTMLEIERALLAKRRRRTLGRRVSFAAAAAAVVAGFGIWNTVRSGALRGAHSPTLVQSAPERVTILGYPSGAGADWQQGRETHALQAAQEMSEGTLARVPRAGSILFKLSTGSELTLEDGGALRIRERGLVQRFDLEGGSLRAHVAKLTSAQRFIVSTPDAEVEVKGTQFVLRVLSSPRPGCTPESRTELEVREGLVEVRARDRSIMVAPGEHWPDCSETTIPVVGVGPVQPDAKVSPPPSNSPKVSVRRPQGGVQTEPSSPPERGAKVAQSALAAQNDLFATGLAAKKRGDTATALNAFSRLMIEYPGSALLETATVERLRLLASTNDVAARTEALRYLDRFPNGFARGEAEKIVGAVP